MSFLKKIISAEKSSVLNESSYEELFKNWYAPLCKLIFRTLKDKALTEDTVQDVFIKLWEKRNELKIETSLKSYLYRAAINATFNIIAKNKRYPKLSIEDMTTEISYSSNIEGEIQARELEQKINDTLMTLPEGCREVFVLSRQEGLSYKEIAETLEISIKTVENQMGKALKVFRERLL